MYTMFENINFNPAIIFTREPPKTKKNFPGLEDTLIRSAQFHHGLWKGYQFANDELVPKLVDAQAMHNFESFDDQEVKADFLKIMKLLSRKLTTTLLKNDSTSISTLENTTSAMDKFAEDFFKNYLACDKNNLSKVSEFLADLLYQFKCNKPFGEVFGMTGICLVNSCLLSLGLPSILLPHPKDKEEYLNAYFNLSTDKQPLAAYIEKQILREKIPTSDDETKIMVELECQLSKLLLGIKQRIPEFNMQDMNLQFMHNNPQPPRTIADSHRILRSCIEIASNPEGIKTALKTSLHRFNMNTFVEEIERTTGLAHCFFKIDEHEGISLLGVFPAAHSPKLLSKEEEDSKVEVLTQTLVNKHKIARRVSTFHSNENHGIQITGINPELASVYGSSTLSASTSSVSGPLSFLSRHKTIIPTHEANQIVMAFS